MSVCSPAFLLFLWVATTAISLAPSRALRQLLLGLASLGFLATWVPTAASWIGFAVFIGGTFALLRLSRAPTSPSRLALSIAAAVLFFLVVKGYGLLGRLLPSPSSPGYVELVGLSYMLFRFLHVLVDQSEEQIERYDLASYASYQLAFFSLVAGPIQRYNAFQAAWDAPHPIALSVPDALRAWRRIFCGMIRIGALSALVAYAIRAAEAGVHPSARFGFLANFYLYPVYLFWNFAGYTDVAIGSAALIGFPLPENFNRPFVARNVLDYWDRWHRTLTLWIRDYVFTTSYKVLAARFPGRKRPLGYGLLALSMFVVGVWHGATFGFVLFGVIHGLAATVVRAYGDVLRSRLGRAGLQRYLKSPLIRLVASLVTFHFICFALLFFSLGAQGTFDRLHAATHDSSALPWRLVGQDVLPHGVAVAMFVALAIAALLTEGGELSGRTTEERFSKRWAGGLPYVVTAVQAFALALVFFGQWAFSTAAPVVVYRMF